MDEFKEQIISQNYKQKQEKKLQDATDKDIYYVIASIVNEEILPHWQWTQKRNIEEKM